MYYINIYIKLIGGTHMEYETIKRLTAEQLNVDESEINLATSFIDDLGADSLDLVDLMMALEEEFDIEVTEDEVENLKTVGDIVDFVKSHTN